MVDKVGMPKKNVFSSNLTFMPQKNVFSSNLTKNIMHK